MQLEIDVVTSKRSKKVHAARDMSWEGWTKHYRTLCGIYSDDFTAVVPGNKVACPRCVEALTNFLSGTPLTAIRRSPNLTNR